MVAVAVAVFHVAIAVIAVEVVVEVVVAVAVAAAAASSEANRRAAHRKGFAKTCSTRGRPGTWNPGPFVDVSWNGWPVGRLAVTKTQKPSQNFVEGILMHNFVQTIFASLHCCCCCCWCGVVAVAVAAL